MGKETANVIHAQIDCNYIRQKYSICLFHSIEILVQPSQRQSEKKKPLFNSWRVNFKQPRANNTQEPTEKCHPVILFAHTRCFEKTPQEAKTQQQHD